ncbi:hypothetical protein FNV43_RR10712 [Rhamnella rubrinervis]|uniref:AIPP2-like SPOC-like domain-containing protein n=1 Tax=Rhamnella rubrinervis TaxID=2594499 RepID=A0A8K0MGZ1_9ROSA|nr:hypothetical protein FNV43_RR10712 [Rhamnella rubrinervis]
MLESTVVSATFVGFDEVMFLVTVCLNCGDKGFSVALVYCNGCQDCAVHRYCLDTLPATFDEYVTWHCEDCKPKVGKTFSLDKPISIPCGLSVLDYSKEMQANEPMIGIKKNRKESISTANKDAHMYEGSSSLHDAQYSENINNDKKLTKNRRPDFKEKEVKFVKALQVAVSDLNASDLIEYDSNYVDSQPIIEPIWRGSFSLCYENFNNVGQLAVVAHLSTIACAKVCETAQLLPELILLKMFRRSHVWPKSFEKYGPRNHDIALYFFPVNRSDENTFDGLVDHMIHQDLAMRTVLENAELLVFTSTVLPMQHWRFQTKFYLWGVFRKKQNLCLASEVVPVGEQSLSLTSYTRSPISPLSTIASCDSDSML